MGCLADLDGRVLTIERGLSLEVLGTTKTNRNRRVTLGATTTAMIVEHFESWRQRVGTTQVAADWIFAPDFRRLSNARADLLSHRFERLRLAAGLPEASLHRLRHSVGTHLVSEGKSSKLKLGSATETPSPPCATMPMPTPLDDLDVADRIDDLLNAAVG